MKPHHITVFLALQLLSIEVPEVLAETRTAFEDSQNVTTTNTSSSTSDVPVGGETGVALWIIITAGGCSAVFLTSVLAVVAFQWRTRQRSSTDEPVYSNTSYIRHGHCHVRDSCQSR
ncbi:uncharacterized protein isoform X2 [Salmo salar]|uniref:Uncharacterized protein isoform X2 n=1 Tax=Salmo salar TaxID=8030 RepID=A0ABM3DP43_SALSA|nr:uncharacterized protein LOC106582054 isoform X2 [Salmo salar]